MLHFSELKVMNSGETLIILPRASITIHKKMIICETRTLLERFLNAFDTFLAYRYPSLFSVLPYYSPSKSFTSSPFLFSLFSSPFLSSTPKM